MQASVVRPSKVVLKLQKRKKKENEFSTLRNDHHNGKTSSAERTNSLFITTDTLPTPAARRPPSNGAPAPWNSSIAEMSPSPSGHAHPPTPAQQQWWWGWQHKW